MGVSSNAAVPASRPSTISTSPIGIASLRSAGPTTSPPSFCKALPSSLDSQPAALFNPFVVNQAATPPAISPSAATIHAHHGDWMSAGTTARTKASPRTASRGRGGIDARLSARSAAPATVSGVNRQPSGVRSNTTSPSGAPSFSAA